MPLIGSEPFKLSKEDLWKIVKGGLIAAAGAFLTFLATIKWDLGPYTLLLAPLISTAINAALKWLGNTEQTVDVVKLLVLLAAGLTLGDAAVARGADANRRIEHDGRTRQYTLHSPPKISGPSPLLVCFHALTQSPDGIARMTGFDALADQYEFFVAYPQGFNRSWNAGWCCNGNTADDVGFASAVVTDAKRAAKVDAKRVYATGFSNGAMMAHRVGIERPDLFAGIAPVGGSIQIPKSPSRPVQVLILHGTLDLLVPLAEARAAEAAWKKAGAPVKLVAYDGLRHQWPGGASERIVAAFRL